jgi:hypothetical protein
MPSCDADPIQVTRRRYSQKPTTMLWRRRAESRLLRRPLPKGRRRMSRRRKNHDRVLLVGRLLESHSNGLLKARRGRTREEKYRSLLSYECAVNMCWMQIAICRHLAEPAAYPTLTGYHSLICLIAWRGMNIFC